MVLLALALAVTIAGQPADDDQSDSSADLASLQQLYAESCGERGYAAYDDICNQISEQVREAERREARAAREHAREARSPKPATTAAPGAKATQAQPATLTNTAGN